MSAPRIRLLELRVAAIEKRLRRQRANLLHPEDFLPAARSIRAKVKARAGSIWAAGAKAASINAKKRKRVRR